MKEPIKRFALPGLAAGLAMAGLVGAAHAKDLSESTGLLDAVGLNINETGFMKDYGLTFGGWINSGISTNFHSSRGRFNGPVTFGDRDAEPQLNQLYLYIERAVTAGDSWDFGGRFDFMYGTDAVFGQAYGSPRGHWDLNLIKGGERFYDMAFPQAYFEVFAPIGRGLTLKAGHFYTIIGNEVVTAPDNFFYSHAYTMQYGEPFTHTGVLLSYPVTDNFTLTGGGVTGSEFGGGWDGAWDKNLGTWAFLGGGTWTSDDKGTSVTLNTTSGEINEHDHNNWSLYSLVVNHDILEGLHYTLQHDHGWVSKVLGGQDAEWYGINQYLTYDIRDDLGVGIRGEWFRDDDGFRVASPGRTLTYFPGANNYFAVTGGLNWKPLKWLAVRPNVRYDWTDNAPAFNNSTGPTGYAANRKDQFLFTTDVVISF